MPPRKKQDPWFSIEKAAVEKIAVARPEMQWEALALALQDLCAARRACANAAHNGKKVQVVESMEHAETFRSGGRFLVRPPLVGKDASLIEHALKSRGHSAIVLCREPITKLGLCPIVSLGSGVTIRTQVEEPEIPEKPTCGWFDGVVQEFGEYVISRIDDSTTYQRQLDYLLAHLSAIPSCGEAYRIAIKLCGALARDSV
tara:strand:+ start:30 stop:632 length:603 start_codon:yes stop_codon:yes gene_type:complete